MAGILPAELIYAMVHALHAAHYILQGEQIDREERRTYLPAIP